MFMDDVKHLNSTLAQKCALHTKLVHRDHASVQHNLPFSVMIEQQNIVFKFEPGLLGRRGREEERGILQPSRSPSN